VSAPDTVVLVAGGNLAGGAARGHRENGARVITVPAMNHPHPLGRLSLVALLLSCLVTGCASKKDAAGASKAAPRPDAYWVYVGTYTGAKSKGVYRMKMDARTGSLGPAELAAETPSPSFLALHPNRRFLYAVNEVAEFNGQKSGSVSAFAVDARTGALSPLNQASSGGDGPCHLVVDPEGKTVVVANYGAGSTAAVAVLEDGRLGPETMVMKHEGASVNRQRQQAPHAHCVALEPGRGRRPRALVADLGADRIFIYRVVAEPGKLQRNDPPSASVMPGSGPRHLAFSPDGRFVYCINELASTLTAFSYNGVRGELDEVQTVTTLPDWYSGNNSTAEIQVHPTGKFVYGSNRGHDSIACFRADPKTGHLTPIGHEKTQGKTPRNFAIDPTGTFLLAANQGSDTVVVFRIDPKTGMLSATGTTASVPTPVCVEFVPVAR
jgi:6-phosphogluconolactonase